MDKINYLDIFDIDYSSDISTGKLFVTKYKKLYHTVKSNFKIDYDKVFAFFEEKFNTTQNSILYSKVSVEKSKIKPPKLSESFFVIELENELLIEIDDYSATLFFSDYSRKDEFSKIISKIPTKQKKKKHSKKFYMLIRSKRTESGFDLQKFKVKKIKIDINDNYNDDFVDVHENIEEFIKDDRRNGIIMLHGKYGTGKSTYIRYLMLTVNKRFIYLPLHLISGLSSPDLVNFFALYKNSILILEDCEEIIKPRSTTNTSTEALVNLLNLGDGLLSDALSIKLVCTFNAELKKIDPAILRKGRLAVRYEFKPLSVDKAKNLVEKNDIDLKIEEPTTVAEIFNTNQISQEFEKNKKLGF